jgi:hypothetical protein
MLLDGAEVAPVDLGLLPGGGLEAHGRLGPPRLAQRLHEGPHHRLLPWIAPLPQLQIELARVEHPVGEPLLQVGHRGIELAGSRRPRRAWRRQQRLAQRRADRLAVVPGQPGDLADGDPFAVQFADHETLLHS